MLTHSRYYMGRGFSAVYRLNGLRVANVVFRNVAGSPFLNRRLFGGNIVLNVSRSNAQRLLWLEGERFIAERFVLAKLVKPGSIILDVGANIGYYALMFSEFLNGSGQIICLEPEPDNLTELRLTIAKSNLEGLVSIMPIAAGANDGLVRLEPGLNGIVSDIGSVEVPVTRIDSLKLSKVNFIKMDVEGYEGAVLEGAANTLIRFRPTVFLELHPHLITGHTHVEIVKLLRDVYSNIVAYRIEVNAGVRRVLAAYGLRCSVRQVPNIDKLIDDLGSGVVADPCWIVARDA